jgi:hypothetical protein
MSGECAVRLHPWTTQLTQHNTTQVCKHNATEESKVFFLPLLGLHISTHTHMHTQQRDLNYSRRLCTGCFRMATLTWLRRAQPCFGGDPCRAILCTAPSPRRPWRRRSAPGDRLPRWWLPAQEESAARAAHSCTAEMITHHMHRDGTKILKATYNMVCT